MRKRAPALLLETPKEKRDFLSAHESARLIRHPSWVERGFSSEASEESLRVRK